MNRDMESRLTYTRSQSVLVSGRGGSATKSQTGTAGAPFLRCTTASWHGSREIPKTAATFLSLLPNSARSDLSPTLTPTFPTPSTRQQIPVPVVAPPTYASPFRALPHPRTGIPAARRNRFGVVTHRNVSYRRIRRLMAHTKPAPATCVPPPES